jgi:hypothetical protein
LLSKKYTLSRTPPNISMSLSVLSIPRKIIQCAQPS